MEKLNPIFESMDVDAEMKAQLSEAFETAVLETVTEKMDEYVETKLTEETQKLEEEYTEKVEYLTEALDGYMDTVVEEFIEENAPVFEAQIDEEKTKTLLETFDKMVKVLGVDMMTIAEAKDESSLETKVDSLNEEIEKLSDRLIEAKREADKYLKAGLIQEMAKDLTILESEKFEKLADMVEFNRDSEYVTKLETIKESIVSSRGEDFQMDEKAQLPGEAFKAPELPNVKTALDFSKYV